VKSHLAAADVSSVSSELERRGARAELLSGESSLAQEPLLFVAGLYRVQARAAQALEALHAERPCSGRLEEDADRVLVPAAAILRYAADSGPEALSEDARSRKRDLPSTARTRLLVYWAGDRSTSEDYLSRAILRPYAETLRRWNLPPDRALRRGRCPFCGGAPWIGARRDAGEMEGARRHLCCALCGVEWPFGRIVCPACLEEDPHKLPCFRSEAHPAVRIEACETCRRYVKSIDLSEDARPIPEVDDLLSLSMDLWAVEEGFTRAEPGLAGL
jgi:formate dehydrogenase maturation protein FdhE